MSHEFSIRTSRSHGDWAVFDIFHAHIWTHATKPCAQTHHLSCGSRWRAWWLPAASTSRGPSRLTRLWNVRGTRRLLLVTGLCGLQHLCVYVCMYVCVCVTCVCMSVSVCACVSVCMWACVCLSMYACMSFIYVCTCMHICAATCMYIRTHMHICTRVFTTHTYTHTHIHTHVQGGDRYFVSLNSKFP